MPYVTVSEVTANCLYIPVQMEWYTLGYYSCIEELMVYIIFSLMYICVCTSMSCQSKLLATANCYFLI
jgi:hypothetical protein